jgi:hypothetical protein
MIQSLLQWYVFKTLLFVKVLRNLSDTLLERIANYSLSVLGRVGECDPPLLDLPITIEPSKPRMCHDERYLNL